MVGAVHLWTGLALGLLFALMGLTGSLLVFYPELDLLLNPSLRADPPVAVATVNWDAVAQRLLALKSGDEGQWRIEVPAAEGRPLSARYFPAASAQGFAPLIVTLDANTLSPTSARPWGSFAVTWIYDLHYSLLAGSGGRQVVGWLGVAMLLLLGSGVALWWPSRGRWQQALRPRLRPGRVLTHFDLHGKLGVYGLLLLLVLCFTGVVLALPQIARPLVQHFSPLAPSPERQSTPVPGAEPIGPTAALSAALARFPGARLRWIELPKGAQGVYRLRLWQGGEPSYRFPGTLVWVDAWTGRVLATRDPARQGGGDDFFAWQHPLHNGEAFGLPGRLLALLGGLLPTALLVTGYLRWQDRRQARQRAAVRRAAPSGG
ncbi:PepSY domain-containing protein [Denitratisoma sp. agr-D3]